MDVVINSDYQLSPNTQHRIDGYGNYYHHLLACLGYDKKAPPVAELLRLYHGLEGQWLVVTPIHWQATHNDAMLLACDQQLNLSEDKARDLFDVFSTFAAEDGSRTYFHDATTWLLQCDGKPPMTSMPPHMILHQSLLPHLKSLDDTFFWQRFMTETQMLLNGRIQTSPAVNGVWLWGSGTLRPRSDRPVFVNHQRAYDLACLLSTRVNFFSTAPLTKNALVLCDANPIGELDHLLSLKSAHWYWNNLAYTTHKQSWFSRLISFKRVK